jgi:hypothetical protein
VSQPKLAPREVVIRRIGVPQFTGGALLAHKRRLSPGLDNGLAEDRLSYLAWGRVVSS